jgi:hypothetical protein
MIVMKNTDKKLQELSQLRLPALQARYAEVVGKPSKSPNKTFLIKAILAAMESAKQAAQQKAPRKSKREEDSSYKVLPVRFEAELVEEMDDAWRRHGLRTRMELFRVALSAYMKNIGETEVAARLLVRGVE